MNNIEMQPVIENVDLEGIKKVLPHREPLLLLDHVVSCTPGKRAIATLTLTGQEDFFRGHFPGMPVMPGVLQLEALAQAGGFAVLSREGWNGKIALFGGADKVRFRRQVLPGDTLRLEVELTRLSALGGKGIAKASVDGQISCEGELTFILPRNQ